MVFVLGDIWSRLHIEDVFRVDLRDLASRTAREDCDAAGGEHWSDKRDSESSVANTVKSFGLRGSDAVYAG